MKKVALVLDNVLAFIYSPLVMILCVFDESLDWWTKIIYSIFVLVITWPFLTWLMYKNKDNLQGFSLRDYLVGLFEVTRSLK